MQTLMSGELTADELPAFIEDVILLRDPKMTD